MTTFYFIFSHPQIEQNQQNFHENTDVETSQIKSWCVRLYLFINKYTDIPYVPFILYNLPIFSSSI